MRLFILSLLTIIATSCASKKIEIQNFNMHLFSDDVSFIERNLDCFNTYKTDKYNTTNDEIFRSSNPTSNVFIEVESNGNNSEDLKKTTLVWKTWHNEISQEDDLIDAKKYTAVMAKLYAADKEIELVDSVFNDMNEEFENIVYDIETTVDENEFNTVRKIIVTFKEHDYY